MKKLLQRITAGILVMIMVACIAPTDVRAAYVSSGKALTAKGTYGSITITVDAGEIIQEFDVTGNALGITMEYSYNTADSYMMDSSNYGTYYGRIIPIKVSKPGVIYLMAQGVSYGIGSTQVTHSLYADQACTSQVGYTAYVSVGESEVEKYEIPSAGTYYLKVRSAYKSYSSSPSGTESLAASILYFADTSVKKLKNKQAFELTHIVVNQFGMSTKQNPQDISH